MSKEYSKTNNNNNTNPNNKPGVRKRYYRNYRRPNKYKGPAKEKSTSLSFRKTSVVIPMFNEEESLRPLTQAIVKVFTYIKMDYEIIFIDDGSTDKSLEVVKELKRQNNNIKYISFRQNYGKAAALQVGFEEAKGDAVITMDADLQDDPEEIPNLLKKLDKNWDVVSGWKKKRYDPFIKKHTSKFFNYTTRLMSGIKIHDFNCGLKAYRKDVVKSVSLYGELHRYIPVLAKYNGFSVTELPVKHHPRRYGKTKYGLSRFFKGFIDLITVAFTTRYVKRPLHFFGMLGSISFFLGFLINAYLTYEWFVHNISLTRRPLLLFGILMIIVGVQLFSVGLIGEMLVYNKHNKKEYEIREKN